MTPIVSIVTPSYNMAPFLRQAVESVLDQDYPSIEYIVMDGGSTDGSVEILKEYSGRLRFVSAPDQGQADAVNRGFLMAQGLTAKDSIFAFLNADDYYYPGAVRAVVDAFRGDTVAGAVYGEADHVSGDGVVLGRYPTHAYDPRGFESQCYICQPACFLRGEVFREAGMLNPALHFGVDYDLWIRIAKRHPMRKIDTYLACSRLHPGAKTVARTKHVYREIFQVLKTHYGYVPMQWIYGYAALLLDGKVRARGVAPPTAANAALSLLLGSIENPRHLFRFWADFWRKGVEWQAGR